jgi:hypothetical protein
MSLAAVYGPYNEDGLKEYNPKTAVHLKVVAGINGDRWMGGWRGFNLSSGWKREKEAADITDKERKKRSIFIIILTSSIEEKGGTESSIEDFINTFSSLIQFNCN